MTHTFRTWRQPFQRRLKFGKQRYCVIEIRPGEDAAEIAKTLREFANQVEQLKT